MNRAERRQLLKMEKQIIALVLQRGIDQVMDHLFGPGAWVYDAHEELYVAPDPRAPAGSQTYYCVRRDGTWFKACLKGAAQ